MGNMGIKYQKNPASLALVNPGKPPKKSKAKAKARSTKGTTTRGGKAVAKAKGKKKSAKKKAPAKKKAATKKKSAKKKSAKKKKPVAKKGGAVKLPAAVTKAARTAATAATKASKAADKAEKAATKASKAVTAVAEKAATKAVKAAVKASKPKKAAKPKKKAAPKKKASKKGKKPRTAKQKAATKKMIAANRAKWQRPGAKAVSKPKRAPTAKSKARYDYSKPWREGRPKPGEYPIKGYNVPAHWRSVRNPGGGKLMPSGTILDPVTKKFVSPRSARGRQLMRGTGTSFLSNPAGALAELRAKPAVQTVEVVAKQVMGLGVGFFGARAAANLAGRSPLVPAMLAPYAPFLAQIVAGGAAYVLGDRVEKLRPYQISAMAGVGLSMLEAVVGKFAPDAVQEFTQVPLPGLGDDLLSYRRALGAYGSGVDGGWSDYYPGDEAILNAMGEYVLPEDLDPAFDVDPMGEYVLDSDLDPAFDVGGGMGDYVLTSDLDPAFEAVGDYVSVDELDPAYDFWGGMGDYAAQEEALYQVGMGEADPDYWPVNERAYDQISAGMGDDRATSSEWEEPVITGIHGPAGGGGIFGRGDQGQQAYRIASAAVLAARKTGASPEEAARAAQEAVQAQCQCSRAVTRRAVVRAVRTAFRGGRAPMGAPAAPAAPVPAVADTGYIEEPGEGEFRQGIFAQSMFDLSEEDDDA